MLLTFRTGRSRASEGAASEWARQARRAACGTPSSRSPSGRRRTRVGGTSSQGERAAARRRHARRPAGRAVPAGSRQGRGRAQVGPRRPRAHLLRHGPRRAAARAQPSGGRRRGPRAGGLVVPSRRVPRAGKRWAELVVELVPSAELVRFTSSGTEASLLALQGGPGRHRAGQDRQVGGHFHGWHDQVAVGSDPPFGEPDTAGLPDATHASVTRHSRPMSRPWPTRCAEATSPPSSWSRPGAAWATVAAARRVPRRGEEADRRDRDAAGLRRGRLRIPVGARRRPGSVGGAPDLTVLGKILAGGMPGGAVCGRADLMRLLSGPAAGRAPGGASRHPQRSPAGGRGGRGHAEHSPPLARCRPAPIGWPRRSATS